MNILLEQKLQKSNLSEKDKYEIRQIFEIVDDEKKQNILKNFDNMVLAIQNLQAKLKEEQEILLGKAISNIEKAIQKAKTHSLHNYTLSSIGELKNTI